MTKQLNMETVNAVADVLEQAGSGVGAHSVIVKAALEAADLKPSYDELIEASRVRRRRELKVQYGAILNPAVRAYLLAQLESRAGEIHRFQDCTQPNDMTGLFTAAITRTHNQFGKVLEPYKPDPACPSPSLKAREARCYYVGQNSYSDDQEYVIPVTVKEGTKVDLSLCGRRLSDLVRRADTHTGMAGSGSNWSAQLVSTEHGIVAVLHCRVSIAD